MATTSESINNLSKNIQEAKKQVNAFEAALNASGNTVKAISTSIGAASSVFNRSFAYMAEGALGVTEPIVALQKASSTMAEDFETLSGVMAAFDKSGSGLGSAIAGLGKGIGATLTKASDIVQSFQKSTIQADQFSGAIRDLENQFGHLGTGMGMSFESTRKFTEEFAKVMSFTRPDFFILPEELRETTALLANQGVAFDELTKRIDTTAGSMFRMEAVVMAARASGETMNATTKTIGDSMMNLGMSFDSAISQYGMIRKASKETGLQFEDIKRSLEGAVRSFEKLGVGMSFAQPIFSSFVSSLERVGLGIKQATGLTQTFVTSLLNLTESAEKAFLLQSMGGTDFGGGGGIFGAQIGMQAQMLDSTDDPAAQANLAMDMADSLKTTLEQFTGGSIVTLQEAADSPELQSTFKVQQELLGQFGISGGKDQARVLELLQGLQAGTVTQEEVSSQLGDLISQEKDLQNETLAEAEKTARNTALLLAQASLGNQVAIEQARYTRALASAQGVTVRSKLDVASKNLKVITDAGKDTVAASIGDAAKGIKDMSAGLSKTMVGMTPTGGDSTSENERSKTGQMTDTRDPQPYVVEVRFTGKADQWLETNEAVTSVSQTYGQGKS